MRIIGTVSKWNDDRGFGFITPNQVGDAVFVHISAFPRDGKRPTVGETVSFEIAQVEGKPSAVKIQRPHGSRKKESRPVERSAHARKSGTNLIQPLISLFLIAAAGYFGYSHFNDRAASENAVLNQSTRIPDQEKPVAEPQFRCDGRQHCSQMRSYEEAKFFIANCPDTKMDGDNDGEPCERQF
jgi:cold shock CspA family protein